MQLTRSLTINLLSVICFSALLVLAAIKCGPVITELVSDPERMRSVILSHGHLGVLIFIGIQIAQIVITAIPGEVVQVAGGYIFGTWLATSYLLIGAVVGSVVVFGLARIMGYTLVRRLISEDKLNRLAGLMASKRACGIIFILFLIPGLPKDVLTYVGGLTPVRPLHFIVIANLARIPGLFVSAYIGANLQEQDYATAIILSGAAVLIFIFGLLYRDQIVACQQLGSLDAKRLTVVDEVR